MSGAALGVLAAVAVAVGLWWATTAAILRLARLDFRHPRLVAAGSVLALSASLDLIVGSRDLATDAAAYASFVGGIGVWAFVEVSFLLGWVTGPRRVACPAGCSGAAHFRHAVEAILWHELAIAALGLASIAAAGSGVNRTGAWTVLLLWAMRTSAKLNLHFGVRNSGAGLLPPRLAYLASFFGQRPGHALLPLTIVAGAAATGVLAAQAFGADASTGAATRWTLLATLAGLGVLEHLVMSWPVRLSTGASAVVGASVASMARAEGLCHEASSI